MRYNVFNATPTAFGKPTRSLKVSNEKLISSVSIRVSSDEAERALAKINTAPAGRLSDFCKTFQGIVTGADDVFIMSPQEAKELPISDQQYIRPFLFGSDIGRFSEVEAPQAIAYVRRFDQPKMDGQLMKRLEAARPRLLKRRETQQGKLPWYSLHWARDPAIFEQPKLLVQGIRNLTLPRRVVATLDVSGAYAGVNLTIVNAGAGLGVDLRGILGILNSSAVNFLFRQRFVDHRIKNCYVDEVPLPISPLGEATEWSGLVYLVDAMLSLHKRFSAEQLPQRREQIQREIDATERQIDALVYQLYGLTDDEIAIVETATA